MKLAMIRLLTIIDRHGQEGISTRRLLQELASDEHHRLLKQAQSDGLVHREQRPKPKGQKGNHLTVNRLTPEGLKVVATAKELGLA